MARLPFSRDVPWQLAVLFCDQGLERARGSEAAAWERRRSMVHIEGEIIIDRPVQEVFDFVADERNEPSDNPRMLHAEQVSSGPIGLGTRFRAEMTSMGRPAAMTIENTGYERPRLLASTTRLSTMDIDGVLLFDPVDGKTRMRWQWDLKPRGVLRLLSPVIALMGRRQEQTIWASLKRHLEAQAVSSPADNRST